MSMPLHYQNNNKGGSLFHKTANGIFWSFLELTGRRCIGILVTLLLARFLVPADFGLVAMVSVFFQIANTLMDSGFQQALIRKKDADAEDYSTMFVTNIALGVVAYVLLFVSAPLIARFYEEPRLVMLVRVIGIVVIVNSLQFVQIVSLSRQLDFKTQFKATIPAGVISGLVAIVMAMNGFGVWALAAQMILSPLFTTAFLWWINPWRPRWVFSPQSFNELFGFGSKLFISGLLNIVFENIYIVVIAKLFTSSITGYYFFATKIRDIILQQLSSSIQKVTYPALASIQDDDLRLKAGYRKVIQATTYLIFPAMIFLAVLSQPLFSLFLKPHWLAGVPYLQLLCVAGLMFPLHVVNLNILQVKGRSDLFLYLEIFKKLLIVVVLFISVRFGIWGLLAGQIATSFLAYLPNSYFAMRLIGYSPGEQIKDVLPALVSALFAGAIMVFIDKVFATGESSIIMFLILQISVGGVIYLAAAKILKIGSQKLIWEICSGFYQNLRRKHT